MEERLRVGIITTTHGIKGEVKVFPTTDDLSRFMDLKKCYLCSEKETIQATCTSAKFVKNMVVLKFEGFDSIEEVEKLRNYDILVDREDAVALEEGEFFICDVIGSVVYDQNNDEVGILDEVLETPAQHVFVIKAKGKEDVYVPVVPSWVDEIDTKKKTVKVNLLEISKEGV